MGTKMSRCLNDLPFPVLSLICSHLATDGEDSKDLLKITFSSKQLFYAAIPYLWINPHVSQNVMFGFATYMMDPLYTKYIKRLELKAEGVEWGAIMPLLPFVDHLQGLRLDFVC